MLSQPTFQSESSCVCFVTFRNRSENLKPHSPVTENKHHTHTEIKNPLSKVFVVTDSLCCSVSVWDVAENFWWFSKKQKNRPNPRHWKRKQKINHEQQKQTQNIYNAHSSIIHLIISSVCVRERLMRAQTCRLSLSPTPLKSLKDGSGLQWESSEKRFNNPVNFTLMSCSKCDLFSSHDYSCLLSAELFQLYLHKVFLRSFYFIHNEPPLHEKRVSW